MKLLSALVALLAGSQAAVTGIGNGVDGVEPLPPFEVITPKRVSGELHDVVYAEGKFVAVGKSTIVHAEGNGTNFRQALGFGSAWYRMTAHTAGRFVALSTAGQVAYSEDGVLWGNSTIQGDMTVTTLSSGDGRFVAAGENGWVAVSNDGDHWWTKNVGTSSNLVMSACGNGAMVVMPAYYFNTEPPTVYVSNDGGTNWMSRVVNLSSLGSLRYQQVYGLAFANGEFLLQIELHRSSSGKPESRTARSRDCITWVADSVIGPVDGRLQPSRGQMDWVNEELLLTFSDKNQGYRRTLQGSWAEWTSPMLNGQISFGAGVCVATGFSLIHDGLGGRLFRGSSVETVQIVDLGAPAATIYAAASSSNTLVATGILQGPEKPPVLLVSTNQGESFTTTRLDGTRPGEEETLRAVHYENGTFAAVGITNRLYHSRDGLKWEITSFPETRYLYDVTYAENEWMIGALGRILYSPDLKAFEEAFPWEGENAYPGVEYGNGIYLITAINTTLFSQDKYLWSNNGTAWGHLRVVFGDGVWIGGSESGLYSSPDAFDWQNEVETPWIMGVAHAKGHFVAASSEAIFVRQKTGTWTKYPSQRFLTGISGSSDEIYITGVGGYVARFDPSPKIRLDAVIRAGKVWLRAVLPGAGVYDVQARVNAERGDWQTVGSLQVDGYLGTWETTPIEPRQIYRVVKR